jgi:hypothetical protein
MNRIQQTISNEDILSYNDCGYLILKGYFQNNEILNLKKDIYMLFKLLVGHHAPNFPLKPFNEDHFDEQYEELEGAIPNFHKIIYDGLKNLPSFYQILSSQRNLDLTANLLNTEFVGVGNRSYGIRIDRPRNEIYNTDWHQDFHTHARSKNGIVFWAPIVDIAPKIGPLKILKDSHQGGYTKLYDYDPSNTDDGNYTQRSNAMKIVDIDLLQKKYETLEPLVKENDLVVFDYRTIHKSGNNVSDRNRWSMQIRYFDFKDEWAVSKGWSGSINAGVNYQDIIPELLIKGKNAA